LFLNIRKPNTQTDASEVSSTLKHAPRDTLAHKGISTVGGGHTTLRVKSFLMKRKKNNSKKGVDQP